ncbi:hypothetical protein ABZN20_15015 [Methylococcus sp. ANG]|uniref:hypothetical protein n=1 Tax=Methylococcus sp. ANG TaxID=3231903 RepID=UPI003457919F
MKTVNSILAGFAGTLLLALGTTVNAEEQLILSDADMDGVTAGYNWSSAGAGASFVGIYGGVSTYSSTYADPYYTGGYASASAAGIWGTSSAGAGSTSVSY